MRSTVSKTDEMRKYMSWSLMEHHPNYQDSVSAENRSQWMLLEKRVGFSWLKEEMGRAWGKISSGLHLCK